MFQTLDIFRLSGAMARHAGEKQAVVAQNVANADTPGYVARDLPDFRSTFAQPQAPRAGNLATRQAHLYGISVRSVMPSPQEVPAQAAPNGNQVSLEQEMLKSVAAKRQHDRALAIYKSALGMLRTSIRSN